MEKHEGKEFLKSCQLYALSLAKWAVIAVCIGVLCGVIGTAFHVGVHEVTHLRGENPWILYLLPLGGLLIVGLYKIAGTEGLGTNDIIEAVHQGKRLPFWLLPSIFIGTVITHLCGGSAGREGAALQMGGTIGQVFGRVVRLDEDDLRIATLAGMAAFFSALFGTPLAATIFSIMVVSVGTLYHAALVPGMMAALVAYGVSLKLGVEPTRFAISVPEQSAALFAKVFALGALCALVAILFCWAMHFGEHQFHKIKNPWLRAVIGGVAIIILTLLVGTDYNGAGMDIVTRAVEEGIARPEAFLLKLLFTVITLSAGFKGGEVVPSFFVGATFGCVAAPLLGLPAGFGAAIALVAVFCGVTNCPVASTFLAVELFGGEGVLYFALACFLSYMLSGYRGLYSSQTILYSKLTAEYVNARTNGYHAKRKVRK